MNGDATVRRKPEERGRRGRGEREPGRAAAEPRRCGRDAERTRERAGVKRHRSRESAPRSGGDAAERLLCTSPHQLVLERGAGDDGVRMAPSERAPVRLAAAREAPSTIACSASAIAVGEARPSARAASRSNRIVKATSRSRVTAAIRERSLWYITRPSSEHCHPPVERVELALDQRVLEALARSCRAVAERGVARPEVDTRGRRLVRVRADGVERPPPPSPHRRDVELGRDRFAAACRASRIRTRNSTAGALRGRRRPGPTGSRARTRASNTGSRSRCRRRPRHAASAASGGCPDHAFPVDRRRVEVHLRHDVAGLRDPPPPVARVAARVRAVLTSRNGRAPSWASSCISASTFAR